MLRRDARDRDLRRVYRDHVDAVFGFLAYSVGRDQAEDLTATTFERVVRHWRRYDAARAGERTWVLAIARNALIDHYRRQSHRRTVSLDASPLLLEGLVDQDDPLARALSDAAFAGWLDGLGDRERQILALRYGGDLSGAEIAGLMDLSEANVHQIISRTLRRLRTQAEASDAAAAAEPPARTRQVGGEGTPARQAEPRPPVEES